MSIQRRQDRTIMTRSTNISQVKRRIITRHIRLRRKNRSYNIARIMNVYTAHRQQTQHQLRHRSTQTSPTDRLLTRRQGQRTHRIQTATHTTRSRHQHVTNRLRLRRNLLTSRHLVRRRIIRRKTRYMPHVQVLHYRLSDLQSHSTRKTKPINQILHRLTTSHDSVQQQTVSTYSRHLSRRTTMQLDIVQHPRLPSLTLRIMRHAHRNRNHTPLANANFNHRLLNPLLLIMVHLERQNIQLIQTYKQSALMLMMSTNQHPRDLFRPVNPGRQQKPPLPMSIRCTAKSIRMPLANSLLRSRIRQRRQNRIVKTSQIRTTKIRQQQQ